MAEGLLFLFLLLIPTQLGYHWWPEWSKVMGIRVDYLSPTLYLLDMVWIGLVLSNAKFLISSGKRIINNKYLWLAIGIAIINTLAATAPWEAGGKWLRIGQGVVTVVVLSKQRLRVRQFLKWIIPGWIILETGLGWRQVIQGGSVQGIFYWLGERSFSGATPGIAKLAVGGSEFIRAYGSFSHPNSLAGFLLVGWLLWQETIKRKNWWYWVVTGMAGLGIMISGSRMIWLLTAGYVIYELRISKKWKTILLGMGLGAGWWLGQGWLGGWDSEGIQKRLELGRAAVRMWEGSPILGVGLQNFLVKLPEYRDKNGIFWLQPVHNIPLLWLSELGLAGVLALIGIIKREVINKWRCINKAEIYMGVVILVTSLVDHYWWTLPQNWWLGIVVWSVIQ
ncbi:O-antigen ligase family protein [Patescibacteria group bacterium]|nr:O-antigen ligase family protein [Patescibacteria group bacterium]